MMMMMMKLSMEARATVPHSWRLLWIIFNPRQD